MGIWSALMADPQSQSGAIALPELVERLQNGGETSVAAFTQDELEVIVDDLPLALESEVIRDFLSKIVARIDRQKHRTFRRIVEIARQDDERTPILLAALKYLGFSGEPTDEEFAWLIHVLSTNGNAMARLDAFDQALRLALQPALQAILEAVATIHPDEAIRAQMATSQGEAFASVGDVAGDYMSAADLSSGLDGDDFPVAPEGDAEPEHADAPVEAAPPVAEAAPIEAAPGPIGAIADDSAAWANYDEKPVERLTVRTLLRSLDPAEQIGPSATPPTPAPEETQEITIPPAEPFVEAQAAPEPAAPVAAPPSAADDAAAWSAEGEEKQPDRLTVRTLLRSVDSASQIGPAPITVAGAGRSGDDAPVTNTDALPDAAPEEGPRRERETVKTLLADATHAGDDAAPPIDEAGGETVETMLRSLETVKLSLRELETAKGVMPPPASLGPNREVPPGADAKPAAPKWATLNLTALSPQERARALAKLRRELAPEERRAYLVWLLDRESDAAFGAAIRREILEFAFDRPVFYAFDASTRSRLGRWIRERAAADALTAAAILGALRRATWTDGEPPHIDDDARAIVDAASGVLARVPSEARVALLSRDFTAWLFAVREFEDKEVLDAWARDEHPGVSEGIFRALAAMDGSASKLGVTEGPTALSLALWVWDRAHAEQRLPLANAIAAGWTRGFVLDRTRFFDAFWKRYEQNESQRDSILVMLASFENEIAAAHAKTAAANPPPAVVEAAPEPVPIVETAPHGIPAFVAPPVDSAPAPVAPEAAPVAEDSAPSEEKVLASFMRKAPDPALATASPAAPSASVGVPPAPVEENEITQSDDDGSMNRYFDQKRRELERVMRQYADEVAPPDASGATEPMPGTVPGNPPSDAPTDPRAGPVRSVSVEDSISEEGEASDDFIPDEGEAMLTDDEKNSSAPKRLPVPRETMTPAAPRPAAPVRPAATPVAPPRSAPAAPRPAATASTAPARPVAPPAPSATVKPAAAAKPAARPAPAGGTQDTDVVLPSEPLRTLSEYTGFLRALSGGTSIDELLGRHSMDYRQYAACMTAWGKLLQSRPDLALRMGQLLRGG